MPTEIELKFRIPDEYTIQKLTSDLLVRSYILDDFSDMPMDAFYYDLSNKALSKRKWTFRMRREGENSVATLKTAAISQTVGGLFSRDEWQCPAETLEEGLSGLLAVGAPAELAEFVKDSEFVKLCRISFNRHRAVLCVRDDTRIEMAIDSGRVEAGGKSEALLELELELLFGDVSAVLELGNYLAAQYNLQKEMISKYERALRLIRRRR